MTKQLSAIENEFKAIHQAHQQEIESLKTEIEKAKEKEQIAMEEVSLIKNGDDPKAYAKAIDQHKTAKSIVEFYDGKLEELKSKPLITNEQYEAYTSSIMNTLDNVNNQAKEEVRELINKLSLIEPKLSTSIDKGNELLEHLQHKLYKDDASITNSKGDKIRVASLENRYKNYELIQSIGFLLNTAQVNNINKQ